MRDRRGAFSLVLAAIKSVVVEWLFCGGFWGFVMQRGGKSW
jgi:hypothetical protein